MFSRRSHHDSTPNALTTALAERRARGAGVLDLTETNPTRVGLHLDARELGALLAQPSVQHYEPAPLGLPSARQAAAASWLAHGVAVAAERSVLTASTSDAYGYLFKLLCDPGDAVLVPTPSYPLLEHLAAYEGVRLVPYALRYDGAWHIDTEHLRTQARQGVRAAVVVTPNNPTGSLLRRADLAALGELGVPLISDEVFGAYALARPAPSVRTALEASEALVFALGGLSKLAALPQLKLAWIAVGGPEVSARAALERLELIADTYLAVSTPVQLALGDLLRAAEPLREALLARLRQNLAVLRAALASTVAHCLDVEGGWVAPVRVPAELAAGSWPLELLCDAGVLVQPGWFYDLLEPPCVVVSLLTEPGVFELGIARLVEHLSHF